MRAYDVTKSTQDLRYLDWDEFSQPSGFSAPEPTAREGTGARAVLYRLPSLLYRNPRMAIESVNELVACRLMDLLGTAHVDTRLVHALICIGGQEQTCWLTRYKGLRAAGEQSVPLELFFELEGQPGESPLDMCVRMGWGRQVAQMMLVDYLTAHRGRDGSGLRVIQLQDDTCALAPLMGGRYALTSAFTSQTWRADPTANLSTNNYLGSQSLEENLQWAIDTFKASGKFPGVALASTSEVFSCSLTQSVDSVAPLHHPDCLSEAELSRRFDRSAVGTESKNLAPANDALRTETGPDSACANGPVRRGATGLPPATLPPGTRKRLFCALHDVYNPMLAQLEGSWQIIRGRWERYARLCRV